MEKCPAAAACRNNFRFEQLFDVLLLYTTLWDQKTFGYLLKIWPIEWNCHTETFYRPSTVASLPAKDEKTTNTASNSVLFCLFIQSTQQLQQLLRVWPGHFRRFTHLATFAHLKFLFFIVSHCFWFEFGSVICYLYYYILYAQFAMAT